MVNIAPYTPGSAEKTVVGVANYSKAKAGEAADTLAQGAGQLRNQVANNASQNMSKTFGLLDQVAGSIGGAIGRAASAAQQTAKYNNMGQAVGIVADVNNAFHAFANTVTDGFGDNPADATAYAKDVFENNGNKPYDPTDLNSGGLMLSNDKGQDMSFNATIDRVEHSSLDPRAKQYVRANLTALKTQYINKVNDKATQMQTDITRALPAKVIDTSVSAVDKTASDPKTTVPDLMLATLDSVRTGSVTIASTIHAGNSPANVEKEILKLKDSAIATAVTSSLNNMGEDPMMNLQKITQLKGAIVQTQTGLIRATPEVHQHILNDLEDAQRDQSVKLVSNQTALRLNNDLDAATVEGDMASSHANGIIPVDNVFQLRAIKTAQANIEKQKQESTAILSSDLPPMAKDAIVKERIDYANKQRAIIDKATAYMAANDVKVHQAKTLAQTQVNAENQAARENVAIANSAITAKNQQQQFEDTQKRQEFDKQQAVRQDATQRFIGGRVAELRTLMAAPNKNKDKIFQLSAEISQQALQAESSALLPPRAGIAIAKEVNGIAKATSEYSMVNQFPYGLWGQGGMVTQKISPTTTDAKKVTALLQATQKFEQEMAIRSKALALGQQAKGVNVHAYDFNTEQQQYFDSFHGDLIRRALNEKWSDSQIRSAEGMLRDKTLNDVPVRHAPEPHLPPPVSKKAGKGLVPPPPPEMQNLSEDMMIHMLKERGYDVTKNGK